jgi:hypothetical protein
LVLVHVEVFLVRDDRVLVEISLESTWRRSSAARVFTAASATVSPFVLVRTERPVVYVAFKIQLQCPECLSTLGCLKL